MPNILVNKPREAQFLSPEGRWDSTTCAHMACPLVLSSLSSHTTMEKNSRTAASPSPHQGIIQETAAGVGQIKTRKYADSLMVLAVTGQSSSIWSCILYKKYILYIYDSHNVQNNATKITQDVLKTSDRLLAPYFSDSSIYFL